MNSPDPLPPPPIVAAAPKKRFPVLAVVLSGIGLLFVLAALGGVKAFFAIKENSAASIAVGNRFVDSMGKHDYAAARGLFVAEVQKKTPADSLKDMELLVEKHHGTFVAPGEPQWFVGNHNGQSYVNLTYPAKYSKSLSTVSMTLLKTDSGWQVYSAHYAF